MTSDKIRIRDYVVKKLEQARENAANPMFWSGHAQGAVSALEDVLTEIDRVGARSR